MKSGDMGPTATEVASDALDSGAKAAGDAPGLKRTG